MGDEATAAQDVGTVVRIGRSASFVRMPDGSTHRCILRGRLRPPDAARSEGRGRARSGERGRAASTRALRMLGEGAIAVGDRVRISATAPGEAGQRDATDATIEEVLPRRSALTRASGGGGLREQVIAANVDQLVVVVAVDEPPYKRRLIDRFLACAEKEGLQALVCVNKADRAPREVLPYVERDLGSYRRLGYGALLTSAATGIGVADLRAALQGKLSVLAGPSGTGKSSLLNAVQPGLRLRTGKVSRRTGKGRHTTSGARLVLLDGERGGFVVDTAGVRVLGLSGLEPRDICALFPDLAEVAPSCKFNDCLHVQEPGCAVRAAAEDEASPLDPQRYDSYVRILETLDEEL